MTMYLRRRARFSAGMLHPPGGHNYLCELTVGGEIDPRTGMVINIKDVDAVLKAQVVGLLDGVILDRDVAELQGTPVTAERLAFLLWSRCLHALPPEGTLFRVTLWPTDTLRAEITPLDMKGKCPMLTLTRSYDFSASHRLHSSHLSDEENAEIFGKCNWSNGHGHNYDVEVTLAGEADPRTGQLFSLQALDTLVEEEVLRPYDHRHLNYDAPEFRDLNPTSENLTRVIWDKLARRLSAQPLGSASLYRVVVRETERNYFEYYGTVPPDPIGS